MSEFSISLEPSPAESVPGFLMRLFEINGEPWSRERFRSRGLRFADIMSGDAGEAMRLFGVDPAPFAATTAVVRSKKQVRIAGEELHRDDWSTLARRWCPCCLADDLKDESLGGRKPGWRPHRRFWWDVAAVLTCPIHAVRLESACQTCGDPITWETGSLTACRFRHSLLACKPAPVAREDVVADAYVVGRLGGGARVKAAFLDGLSLREALDAMEHFGAYALDGAFGALEKFDAARHPEVFSAGFRVAAGWPESFERLLDGIAARPDVGLGVWGLDQVYGYLVMWARSIKATALGRPVYEAVLAHYARRSTVRAGSAAAEFVEAGAPVNMLQIAQALGMKSPAVKAQLIAHGLWPMETKRGTPVLFPPGTVADLKARIADHAALEDLPAILGLALRQTKDVVAAGFFAPLALTATLNLSRRRFSRAGIAAWIDGLAGAAPVVEAAPDGLIDVVTACRHACVGGVVGAVRMIETGQVTVRARLKGEAGLRSFLVDADEVARANRVAIGAEMDLADAGRALGLHPETVGTCVKAGLLDHVTIGQKIAIPGESVERFKATYVTARELAGPLGSRERYVIDTLTANGVLRAPSKGSRDPNVTIYLRAEIPENLADLHRARLRRE